MCCEHPGYTTAQELGLEFYNLSKTKFGLGRNKNDDIRIICGRLAEDLIGLSCVGYDVSKQTIDRMNENVYSLYKDNIITLAKLSEVFKLTRVYEVSSKQYYIQLMKDLWNMEDGDF